jgi:mRNA-degrading endonuclease RelE of RelBE toxin-antitoxin system
VARVVLARRAPRDLLDLDWPLIDAIEDALGLLAREPRGGHALRARLQGLWSLRLGAYRVIYRLTAEQTYASPLSPIAPPPIARIRGSRSVHAEVRK